MSAEDFDFEQTDAGASLTYPSEAGQIKKNGHVVIKGRPCRVMETSHSKTGKHGHAKVHMIGIDIFTGRKYEDVVPSTHNVEVPNISRIEMQLVSIDDEGFATLMDESGDLKEDLRIPEDDVGEQIRKYFEEGVDVLVGICKAMGEEKILSVKEMR